MAVTRRAGWRQRLALVLLGLFVGAAASVVLVGVGGPAVSAMPRTVATPEASPEPPPTPEPVLEPEPVPAGSPAPASAPVPTPESRLVAEAGPPVRADQAPAAVGQPVRVVIPAIDVDVPLVAVGLLASGAMEVPDFGLAGWYRLGPKPGEPGPAVLAGHVDSRAGPDVFFRLRELEAGDEVRVVDAEGSVSRFTVVRRELTAKDALPVERIWNDTDEAVLRLITCGGQFDRRARSYRSNVIVYADPAA